MPAAGLGPHQESEHEGAILLEEEDVLRLLLIDIPAYDAERLLIVASLAPCNRALLVVPSGVAFFLALADVWTGPSAGPLPKGSALPLGLRAAPELRV